MVEAVGDETVSRLLGEPGNSNDDHQTLAVPGGIYQRPPANSSDDNPVEIENSLDFLVRELDEGPLHSRRRGNRLRYGERRYPWPCSPANEEILGRTRGDQVGGRMEGPGRQIGSKKSRP